MSFLDKIKRHIASLKLIKPFYLEIKNDWHAINWYKQHKKEGVPFDKRYDEEYLDWHYNFRKDLLQYKDIHKGEDCFIIGNGPSLNKTDLSLLENYNVFGLNKINLIFEKYPSLKLSYHVVVNPLVIEQMETDLNNNVFNCPSFLSYQGCKNANIKTSNNHKIMTNAQWSFYYDIAKPISEGYTVTYAAMQIAYYMGFQNVYLIGVDHSFQQKGKANEQQDFKGDDVNHFHPDYFKGQQWHLADLEGNEASYALAKHAFHAAGKEIFDATIDGKLTIFDKISFEQAIKQAKKK